MLSGTTTQLATSVQTLFALALFNDTDLDDGEFACVQANDTYYRINRNALSGPVQTLTKNGYWTVFAVGAAALSGPGGPPATVTPGVIYINTTTGATYAGTTTTWVLIGTSGPTPTRPAFPAGTTHGYNWNQPHATAGVVPDQVGTASLGIAGVVDVDYSVQQSRPFLSDVGTRFHGTIGASSQPVNDNPNTSGYTLGVVFFEDTFDSAGNETICAAGNSGGIATGMAINLNLAALEATITVSDGLANHTYTATSSRTAGTGVPILAVAEYTPPTGISAGSLDLYVNGTHAGAAVIPVAQVLTNVIEISAGVGSPFSGWLGSLFTATAIVPQSQLYPLANAFIGL